MYKWGHPVATLPSEEGDYTSLSQNDANSANHMLLRNARCARPTRPRLQLWPLPSPFCAPPASF
eukprot:6194541-Pleurochrysis_carterae.AAC.1